MNSDDPPNDDYETLMVYLHFNRPTSSSSAEHRTSPFFAETKHSQTHPLSENNYVFRVFGVCRAEEKPGEPKRQTNLPPYALPSQWHNAHTAQQQLGGLLLIPLKRTAAAVAATL